MLTYVLNAAFDLKPQKIVVVIGHGGDQVKKAFSNRSEIEWVWQKDQRGTGDAVRVTSDAFSRFQGDVLILYGDIPGVQPDTLRNLMAEHDGHKNSITLLTAQLEDPSGYGRIVTGADGSVLKIVEERDTSPSEKQIQEINTGIGVYEASFLFQTVRRLQPKNSQKEFYLTDLVQMAKEANQRVGRLRVPNPVETLGINDLKGLRTVAASFGSMEE